MHEIKRNSYIEEFYSIFSIFFSYKRISIRINIKTAYYSEENLRFVLWRKAFGSRDPEAFLVRVTRQA